MKLLDHSFYHQDNDKQSQCTQHANPVCQIQNYSPSQVHCQRVRSKQADLTYVSYQLYVDLPRAQKILLPPHLQG